MKFFLTITVAFLLPMLVLSQKDSTIAGKPAIQNAGKAIGLDSASHSKHTHERTPRGAAIRSAIIPGWGQIYNRKYWKVPIVYAGVGIPAYFFFDNKKWYNRTKFALAIVVNNTTDPDSLSRVDPSLRSLVDRKDSRSLLTYRNDFRRNMDYSILVGILLWGLNIVDATVDAHLKDFDISNDLSLKIKPAILYGGQAAGVSLVLTVGKTHPKTLPSSR